MPDLSETYISVRGEARGKKKLDVAEVNPLLREYRQKLETFKIEEKSDGRQFKVWVQECDEFNSELLEDEKTLLFSHKLRLNIFDDLLRSYNNYAHSIQAKLGEALGKIQVENGKTYSQKIVIETTGIKFAGGGRTAGRWPVERLAGIGF